MNAYRGTGTNAGTSGMQEQTSWKEPHNPRFESKYDNGTSIPTASKDMS